MLTMIHHSTGARPALLSRRHHGLSLVELMVGITIGLFVTAAASLVVTYQLTDNRRLLLELQVQQDLRATADVIARELRRAGGRQLAANGVWSEANPATANPFGTISLTTLASGNTVVRFDYERGINLQPLGFGFENSAQTGNVGVIQSYIGTGWQDLTDRGTMDVTRFTVTPSVPAITNRIPCPKLCPAGDDLCWPTLNVRSYVVLIEARARTDDRIQGRLLSEVRLRNDEFGFGTGLSALQPCPA
jgi:type IV pilus assembly protein PilW